jgi:hypothetical protein
MAGRRKHPEDDIQRGIVQFLKFAAAPGVLYFAVPNGGMRSHLEAAIMSGLGVVAGIPDLVVISPTTARAHMIEVKAPNGRLSPAQREFRDRAEASGIPYAEVRSLDEAIRVLDGWCVTKTRREARAA